MDRVADSQKPGLRAERLWSADEAESEIYASNPEDWICHIDSRTAADGRSFLSSSFTRLNPTEHEVWKLSVIRHRFDVDTSGSRFAPPEETYQVVVQRVHPAAEPRCVVVGDRALSLFSLIKEQTRNLLIGEAVYNPLRFEYELSSDFSSGGSAAPVQFPELLESIHKLSTSDWNLRIVEHGGRESRSEQRFTARTGQLEIVISQFRSLSNSSLGSAESPSPATLSLRDSSGSSVAHSLSQSEIDHLAAAAQDRIRAAGNTHLP